MTTVPKLWPGETVACLATGPSLTAEDVEYVRGKARVIAINDAHRLAPWADVLYSSDRRWWPYHKAVPSFHGLRYGIGSAPGKRNPFREHPEIVVLKNSGYTGLETHPGGLMNGKNSGYAAINLAVHFGAVRILLLGYNMGHVSGASHFFGEHPPALQQPGWNYASFRAVFASLVAPLAALGVQVFNCTPETSLTAFPICPLREVLA